MNIQEYCDALNLDIIIRYYPNQNSRWCARIDRAEIAEGRMLISAHGNGDCPFNALADYLTRIRGKKIIIDSYGKDRREYIVPTSVEV